MELVATQVLCSPGALCTTTTTPKIMLEEL